MTVRGLVAIMITITITTMTVLVTSASITVLVTSTTVARLLLRGGLREELLAGKRVGDSAEFLVRTEGRGEVDVAKDVVVLLVLFVVRGSGAFGHLLDGHDLRLDGLLLTAASVVSVALVLGRTRRRRSGRRGSAGRVERIDGEILDVDVGVLILRGLSGDVAEVIRIKLAALLTGLFGGITGLWAAVIRGLSVTMALALAGGAVVPGRVVV